MDVQADLNLCRTHRSYCRFCHALAKNNHKIAMKQGGEINGNLEESVAIWGNQWQLAILWNHWQSEGISGNLMKSVTISGNQWQFKRISGNRKESVAIWRNQWESVGISSKLKKKQTMVIWRNQWQSEGILQFEGISSNLKD